MKRLKTQLSPSNLTIPVQITTYRSWNRRPCPTTDPSAGMPWHAAELHSKDMNVRNLGRAWDRLTYNYSEQSSPFRTFRTFRTAESCASSRAPTSTVHEYIDEIAPSDEDLGLVARRVGYLTTVETIKVHRFLTRHKISMSRPMNREDVRGRHIRTFIML